MKRSILISMVLALTAIDWLVVSHTNPSVTQAAKVPNTTCVHVGRLVDIQGKVQLKRKEWLGYHPASIGTELCVGDFVQPAKGAKVLVQCADLDQNLWIVPGSLPSSAANGCRPPNETIFSMTEPIIRTHHRFAHIPYIISPSNTWLLGNKPTIRWQSVPGATSYVVRVAGPGVDWIREVNTTSIVYPGEPPLTSLTDDYLITVVADNGAASDKATFSLLDDPKKATRVKVAVERLNRHGLSDEEKTLAVAEIYLAQGLIAEATELLEVSVAKGSQTAAVYYILGNLYTHLELFRQAEKTFLQAVKLATTTNDIEGQLVASARLWELYTELGESDAAIYWHKQTQDKYQTLAR